MKRRKLAWAATILMPFVVIGAFTVLARDTTVRNIEWISQMAHTPEVRAFTANKALRTGTTLQLPVPGTIARGQYLFAYGPTPQEAERAGLELANPLPLNEKNLMRGKKVFTNQCVVCHGAKGLGDGPIIPKYPNPPSFKNAVSRALKDGALYHIITLGRNNMPAHGPLVLSDDRWRLVHYIRLLQRDK